MREWTKDQVAIATAQVDSSNAHVTWMDEAVDLQCQINVLREALENIVKQCGFFGAPAELLSSYRIAKAALAATAPEGE